MARHAAETRHVVTCRIKPDLIRRLDELGEVERRSRSELIEMAVELLLDKHAPAKPARKPKG